MGKFQLQKMRKFGLKLTCPLNQQARNGGLNLTESQTWINFMDQHKISWCNWSLNDKAETASALVPGASTTGPWPDRELTASGRFLKSQIMKNTNNLQ